MALAYTEGYVTNERLRYALSIHKADIYSMLKDMCNQGYLEPEGHGRGTKYHLLDHGKKVDNLGSNLGSTLGSQPLRKTCKTQSYESVKIGSLLIILPLQSKEIHLTCSLV